jgi:hypothetical protein
MDNIKIILGIAMVLVLLDGILTAQLQIDGRVLVGAIGAFYHQYSEDYSLLGTTNTEMGESHIEMAFHLKTGNFGEYIMFRAQNFNPNPGYYNDDFNPNNNTVRLVTSSANAGTGFAVSIPYFSTGAPSYISRLLGRNEYDEVKKHRPDEFFL